METYSVCECPVQYKGNTYLGSGFYSDDMFLSQQVIGEIVAERYTLSSTQAPCIAYMVELFLCRHLSMTCRLKLYKFLSIPNNFSW